MIKTMLFSTPSSQDVYAVMINFLSAIIHNRQLNPCELLEVDIEDLYECAKKHSLAGMLIIGLDNLEGICQKHNRSNNSNCICNRDQNWNQVVKSVKEKAVRDAVLFDYEWSIIQTFLEERKIWYLPLKGMVLKDYYPETGMRQMADYDILFDSTFQKELYDFMRDNGYDSAGIGRGNHDAYYKEPILNFEFHTSLYDQGSKSAKANKSVKAAFGKYYENVFERLLPKSADHYEYYFTDEDFYLYFISHMYKHVVGGGTGIRSLLDWYLYLVEKEQSMDWEYLAQELEVLKIGKFETENRILCKKLFSNTTYELTEQEKKLFDSYMNSGTYGTMAKFIQSKIRNLQSDDEAIRLSTKVKYILGRLFPGMEHYRQEAPMVARHKWMIPFYIPFRLIRGVLKLEKRKKMMFELKKIVKICDDEKIN